MTMAIACRERSTASAEAGKTLDPDVPEQCFVIEGVEAEWAGYARLYVGDATFRRDLSGDHGLDEYDEAAEWLEADRVTFLVEPLGEDMMVLRVQTPSNSPAAWTLGQVAANLLIEEIDARRSSHIRRRIFALAEQRTELDIALKEARSDIENYTRGTRIVDLSGRGTSEHLAFLTRQRAEMGHEYESLQGELAITEAVLHQRAHVYVPGVGEAVRADATLRVLKEELGALVAESITADQDAQRQRATRRITDLEREIARREAEAVRRLAQERIDSLTTRLGHLEGMLAEQDERIDLAEEDLRQLELTRSTLRALTARDDMLVEQMVRIDEQIAALKVTLETGPKLAATLSNRPLP